MPHARLGPLATAFVCLSLSTACNSDEPAGPAGPVGSLQATGGELADPAAFTVASATVSADGWVAVWHEFGDSHTLAGKVFLTAGAHTNVVVPLDPPVGVLAATQGLRLGVSLHADSPADGAFTATDTRVDGPDPVMLSAAGKPVYGILDVSLPPAEPNAIVAENQTLTVSPPSVNIVAAISTIPTYLVIRNAAGVVIGTERLFDRNFRAYAVRVDLPRSWVPAALTAALYANANDAPDLDAPVLDLAGDPVTATFTALYAPENTLTVTDQTLSSFGYKIALDEVDVDELPAIVAVHADASGAPGEVLGVLAIDTSPKVHATVNLRRFVLPSEALWVAVYQDLAPLGTVTAADPALLGTDGQPLRVKINVTNTSCEGLKTKFCDPATPNVIRWRDRCDAVSNVTTACGDGTLCDDSGPYVACKAVLDPCAGVGATVCIPEDPTATWLEDACGFPLRVATRCDPTFICKDTGGAVGCAPDASWTVGVAKVCDATAPSKLFWVDRSGARTGDVFDCVGGAVCDASEGDAVCTQAPACVGNATLVCDPLGADATNLYWLNSCGDLSGATIPCEGAAACDDSAGDASCVDATPCAGAAKQFCDPADLTAIKWVGPCGDVLATRIPCGAGTACRELEGTPRCAALEACGGNTAKVCVDDDPSNVYWVDGCGELTGSVYPCGVATCDDTAGEATCTLIASCEDEKRRVCDPADTTVVKLKNACGEDLGVFATCDQGKQCTEATAGDAQCACVPTETLACFGTSKLYEPSGITKVDSCGLRMGPVVTECLNGEVCEMTATGPACGTSLTNRDSPMYHRGCSFPDYLAYKTDLDVECRCRRQPGTIDDINRFDMSGNMACMNQADSWAGGWTTAAGPHFRHMLHSFNGGGVYSATHNEIFATKHFTDPTYEGAGIVVGYNITTGARRIVSGRFPEDGGAYTMYGSGFESQRAVGVLRHEMTTLPGAWDLEQAANGQLYVWGSSAGNKEITRVDPDTGLRTLVWKQALESDTPAAPAHGQCYSTRPKNTFFGGFIPVQLEHHGFAMGPDGSFYLGFRNEAAEGNGIVKISADGATCTVISRWNGTMSQIGTGATPQYSTIEGYFVRDGKLYATLQIGKVLLSIDIVNGNRTAIPAPAGSVVSTTGQSTMFWDDTRDLLITAGAVQAYSGDAVDITTGLRQAVYLVAPDMPIKSAPPWETNAHGAIDNGNYMGYGALVMDPHNNDHLYLVIKWGLLKYEMSTGNSYVMSQ